MMENKKLVFGILLLAIVSVVFISGCVQEEVPPVNDEEVPEMSAVPETSQDSGVGETYLSCGNGECEPGRNIPVRYGQFQICPDDCLDCVETPEGCFRPDYPEETYLTCPQDCPNPKDALEEKIPEIKDYPKFEQVVLDLHSSGGLSDRCIQEDGSRVCYNEEGTTKFTDSEIKYIKALFEIFKSKTDLHQVDEEVLAYLVTNTIEPDIALSKIYAMDMEYFVEEVIPLADSITEGSSGEKESIEKIVSWVRENIEIEWTAGYEIGDDTVKAILERKEVPTHCDYWATVITALCRASGIPAREVAGSSASRPGGHAWTEAYVNGEWIMVDSTGALEESPEQKNWLHSVWAYDPLNDRVMDVSLSYNTEILNLVIEHAKELVGETSAIKQAEEIFTEYKKETDLANKYAYGRDIMEICISKIIAKQEGYESEDIKVLDLWDWDKLKKDEAFLSELEKAKAISVYDVTSEIGGGILYKGTGISEFPLEKIDTVIPEIKQLFHGEIYFFFAHYKSGCNPLSDAIAINLFDPEDVDTLETAYQDLFTGTPELLKDFVIEIASVVSKEKDSTTFRLPEYIREGTEYSIVTSASFDRENLAFDILFDIQSMIKIQDIMMVFIADQADVSFPELNISEQEKWNEWSGGFDNLKLINKEGKVYADPEIYRNPRSDSTVVVGPPYNIDDSPASRFIAPGQTIEIYSEDDLVIIKGNMTTDVIVVS
ncbi:MAG: transglutaminase-like domain-containing protein [Candidatus Diapherotrites archaeon]